MSNVDVLVGKVLDVLVGKVLTECEATEDYIRFKCTDGSEYVLSHIQDCCERVTLTDTAGDISDLIGSPLLIAEEVTSDPRKQDPPLDEDAESWTWTFYKFATVKGYVTFRWYGASNGCYSERASFYQIGPFIEK